MTDFFLPFFLKKTFFLVESNSQTKKKPDMFVDTASDRNPFVHIFTTMFPVASDLESENTGVIDLSRAADPVSRPISSKQTCSQVQEVFNKLPPELPRVLHKLKRPTPLTLKLSTAGREELKALSRRVQTRSDDDGRNCSVIGSSSFVQPNRPLSPHETSGFYRRLQSEKAKKEEQELKEKMEREQTKMYAE